MKKRLIGLGGLLLSCSAPAIADGISEMSGTRDLCHHDLDS